VILIRLRIESVYLPLSKRVVKGRTDLIGIDVEPRRGRPIIFEMGADSVRLLIRGHIGDFGKLTHFGDKFRGPLVEFIHIGIFECVLILCAADTIIDCEVLNGLQVDVNAGYLVRPLLQPSDHLRRGFPALLERLQIYLDSSTVQCRIDSIGTNKRGQIVYRRVFQNFSAHLALLLRHCGH